MVEGWLYLLFWLLPKNALSRVVGAFVSSKWSRPFVAAFAKYYRINLQEAERPLSSYHTIQSLFTRRLKSAVRPIRGSVVHPADAMLTQAGVIKDGKLLQVKGKLYSVDVFLNDVGAARALEGGMYFTYYLCPTDYHRVHSPVRGSLSEVVHMPGQLWPVNPWSVRNVQDLFCVNERVLFPLETERGLVWLVMIGATNVGQIEIPFDEKFTTNSNEFRIPRQCPLAKKFAVNVGDELGVFRMGSSVVALYPKGYLPTAAEKVDVPKTVHLGDSILPFGLNEAPKEQSH